jgi:hypothetical protein
MRTGEGAGLFAGVLDRVGGFGWAGRLSAEPFTGVRARLDASVRAPTA